jgi:DNA invertase Pin-like site-specific DNA recombinase
MLAFSLARVSTPEQRHNASISTQLAANQTYAAARGLTIEAEFAEEESGATLDRAGTAELLRRVRAGEVRHIIVYSLDRLTREPADFLPLRKELHGRGVTIHVAGEDRTLSTDPLDELPDDIKVIVAKHERAVFRERSMRGVRAKVESGRPIGSGPAPYGYAWEGHKRTRTLLINRDEAPVVQLIFAWYVVGDGDGPLCVPAIVQQLNERHIPTRADTARRPKKLNGYAQWNAGSVRAILRNPIYGGEGMAFRKRNATIGAKHATARARSLWRPFTAPEIVRPELVRLAQAKIADGRAQSQRRTRRAYLLRCRIRCVCGYSLSGTTTNGGTRHAYRCISRDTARGRAPCGLPYVPGPLAEAKVWAWLCDEVLNPERLKVQAARLDQTRIQPPSPRALDEQRLSDTERKIAALLDLYLDNKLSKALLDERHAALIEEQAQIRARLAETPEEPRPPNPAFLEEAYTFAAIISAGLEDMTPTEQRRVVDLLDTRLIATRIDGRLLLHATCRLRRDVVRLFVDASSRSSCSQSDELIFHADLTLEAA